MISLAARLLLVLARRMRAGGVIINEHTLTEAQTRMHVQALGRWFDFIGLEDLPARLARSGRRPFCLLTFDDGKRSNFSETAPELKRLHVPAVFYVTTEPLANGAYLWFDRREQLVRALGHCPAGLDLDSLKQLPLEDLTRRLEAAYAECGFKPDDESDDLRPMSWGEVRSLARRGFKIGAHGLTHAILTRETRKRAFGEIEKSIAQVSRETGEACTTFAFPNGNFDEELTRHAIHCGASTIMTTEPMWVDSAASLWRLPRIQLFPHFSRTLIESKLALAAFKGVLANPNGTGREYCIASRERATRLAGSAVPGPGF